MLYLIGAVLGDEETSPPKAGGRRRESSDMRNVENWLSRGSVGRKMEFLRLCKALHRAMQDGIERSIRQTGVDLTTSQLDVIISIAQGCGRPVNQRDIEEELRLTNPTVTGILKRLERKGFVTRTVGSRDRRYKEVRLTERCALLGESLHPSAQEMLGGMFRGFTQEDFDTLTRLLRQLVENCKQLSQEEGAVPAQAVTACPSGAAR